LGQKTTSRNFDKFCYPKAMAKEIKTLLDFDGTLTDEVKQAAELALIAKKMLAEEILDLPLSTIEQLYQETKENILKDPHAHHWLVNGQAASYAYEGAYILNTVILQQILSRPEFRQTVSGQFAVERRPVP